MGLIIDSLIWIAKQAVIPSLITGVIFYFGRFAITERIRTSIKAEYDHKLEILRAQLKAEGDVELERQKHLLSLEANQRNLQFARLHETRADVVSEIHAALNLTYEALRNYTAIFEPAGMAPKEARLQALIEAHNKLKSVFDAKRIWIPRAVATNISDVLQDFIKATNTFTGAVVRSEAPNRTEIWLEISKKVDGPIKASLDGLELEFRKIIGDT